MYLTTVNTSHVSGIGFSKTVHDGAVESDDESDDENQMEVEQQMSSTEKTLIELAQKVGKGTLTPMGEGLRMYICTFSNLKCVRL